jgi:hypothetical protein
MKLYLDDTRPAPDGWKLVTSVPLAQTLLASKNADITHISLDHDLGTWQNGLHLVEWMLAHELAPENVNIHSWNTVGVLRMATRLRDYGIEPTTVRASTPQ